MTGGRSPPKHESTGGAVLGFLILDFLILGYRTQTFGNDDTQKRKIESRRELRGSEQASTPLALQLEGAVMCAQQHIVIRPKSEARGAISPRQRAECVLLFPNQAELM